METQMSVFAMLDSYETPEIPPEEQKAGMRGWIIECSGIFLRRNGYDHDSRGVCTRPIEFTEDTKKDAKAYDGWCQAARTIKGPHHEWLGPLYKVFRRRPTWNDCLKFMADTKREGDPEEVEYYEIIGMWEGVKRTL